MIEKTYGGYTREQITAKCEADSPQMLWSRLVVLDLANEIERLTHEVNKQNDVESRLTALETLNTQYGLGPNNYGRDKPLDTDWP